MMPIILLCVICFLLGCGYGKTSTPSKDVWLEAEKYNIDRRWEYIRQREKDEEAEE